MSQENLARNHTMQTAACTSIVSLENNSEQSGHSTKADGESRVYSSNTGATSGKTWTKKNIEKYYVNIKKNTGTDFITDFFTRRT